MPIRLAPYSLKCPKCSWSKTYAPGGDVLHHLVHCPSCGSKELTRSPFNPLLGSLVREITRIGKVFRRRK